ncbi:MAG: transcription elongation factor GreA [Gammaproteobacteria bacterium]|nr:transcription elongation factor GreA [Gammaproteobacteria bacterium]
MNRVPMTAKGAQQLREELQELKSVARPRVIQAIAEARAHGDLRENAEYAAAKEQQGFIEGRIAEIEGQLSNAQIIDIAAVKSNGKIVFGATVDLMNIATEEQVTYQIVGDLEADIKANKISISSPIARALIGKEEGDIAVVRAPGGEIEYEIVAIKYI